jgi:peptide methionine sulfoxide reductase MsrB
VNQWTLIFDILFPDLNQGDGYSGILEIQNDPNSDADVSVYQVSPGVGGIGISGQYEGNITAGQWHRIVLAVDMAATTPVMSKFVDGAKVADQTIFGGGNNVDGRFSLTNVAHLFSDGGHDDEVNTYYVNSVQIRDGKLSDDEAAALGGPQASGIPLPYQVTGQWDFDQGDLRATVGQDLQYGDATMPGQTSFGTTTSFGIPDMGGQPAKVMKYTRNENPPDNYVGGYAMNHGIASNGNGSLVNRWTLIFDILFPDLSQGDGYSGILEIQNDPNSDADVSVYQVSPGVGGIGISGQYEGNISAGQWHRIVVAVDMAADTPVPVMSKFVDGAKVADQTIFGGGNTVDGRFSLNPVAHIFSDGGHDDEVNTYYVNSVQIRDGKLDDYEAIALGGPQASGIPLVIPGSGTVTRPTLRLSRTSTGLTISWDASATGFLLETTPSLSSPNWITVQGVTGNSVTVTTSAGAAFYRLRQ